MSAELVQPRPDENQNIVDIRSRKTESAEIIDFSEASVDIVTEAFLSQLRHPSRAGLRGESLAAFIDEHLSPKPDEETFTLESRIARLVDEANITAVYDDKIEHDMIYKLLFELQQKTREQARQFSSERHASMNLLKLRSANTSKHTTPDDPSWEDVIGRLFDRL